MPSPQDVEVGTIVEWRDQKRLLNSAKPPWSARFRMDLQAVPSQLCRRFLAQNLDLNDDQFASLQNFLRYSVFRG